MRGVATFLDCSCRCPPKHVIHTALRHAATVTLLTIQEGRSSLWAAGWEADLVWGEVDAEGHELDGDDCLQHHQHAEQQDGAIRVAEPRQAVYRVGSAQRVDRYEGKTCHINAMLASEG